MPARATVRLRLWSHALLGVSSLDLGRLRAALFSLGCAIKHGRPHHARQLCTLFALMARLIESSATVDLRVGLRSRLRILALWLREILLRAVLKFTLLLNDRCRLRNDLADGVNPD